MNKFNIFSALNRCVGALCATFRNRSMRSAEQSRQIAHLYYRVEQLSQYSEAINWERAGHCPSLQDEESFFAETENLKSAVIAAKEGVSSKLIAEKYGLYEAESELIVSVHGNFISPPTRKLH